MVQKVLECDVTKEGRKRPEWLSVGKHGVNNIKRLLEIKANGSYVFKNHPEPEKNA